MGESRGRLGAMLELMVQDIGGFNAIYFFIGFSFGYFNLYFSSMKGVMMLRLFCFNRILRGTVLGIKFTLQLP